MAIGNLGSAWICTGVDWCRLTLSQISLELVEELRDGERHLREALGDEEAASIVRIMAVEGVDAAQALESGAGLATEELFDRCLLLVGKPWEQAPCRRDMRERIRVARVIAQGMYVPADAAGLLGLWAQATAGEVAWYSDCTKPQFRTRGTPFGHGEEPFADAPAPEGFETVAPAVIPEAVDALLAFMCLDELPIEVRAAATHFLFGHIHPFRDGNGRSARMLSCLMLASGYSQATLVALVRQLQRERKAHAAAMATTVRGKRDLDDIVRFFFKLLRAAQHDVLFTGSLTKTPGPDAE